MDAHRTTLSVIRPHALRSLLAGALAATLLVLLAPLAPHAATEGPVDLASWTADVLGNDPQGADWQVAPDGLSVFQGENGPPTLFISSEDAVGVRIEGRIRVLDDQDDDFVGFGFGVHPGDFTNPDADWILIDWKKRSQNYQCRAPDLA